MALLIDPESALSVTATALARPSGRTYMNSVHFSSPQGAHLEFTIEGVKLAGLGDKLPTNPHPLTGHQEYGDISFLERFSKVNYVILLFACSYLNIFSLKILQFKSLHSPIFTKLYKRHTVRALFCT